MRDGALRAAMCDLAEEELAEYLRWWEAARVRAASRPIRGADERALVRPRAGLSELVASEA
jgi:hypothetical protein